MTTEKLDRALDAATGAIPTGSVVASGIAAHLLNPDQIIKWGTATVIVLTILIHVLKLYREWLGARRDREEMHDDDDA